MGTSNVATNLQLDRDMFLEPLAPKGVASVGPLGTGNGWRAMSEDALRVLLVAVAGVGLTTLPAHSTEALQSLEVAAGCDAPAPSEGGHRFFVDPTRGSRSNDGSEQKPWRTLAEVLDPATHLVATPINPDGPIRPGDVVVLMTGDHGTVAIEQYANKGFISVVAGEGQTPVVRSLNLIASSHWLFRGVRFQGSRPEGEKFAPLVGLRNDQALGPSDNIVFVDNTFSTEDSTANWSPQDWVDKPYATGFRSAARCTTVLGNHFFNLRDAIGISGNQSLIQDNLIEDMGNDGIDVVASDVVIRRNRIRSGRHTPAEPLHPDAIQGWTAPGATNRNVEIDANSIINLNPAPDNGLQGISIFDGKWDGLRVTNNLVITNAGHCIALFGVTNAAVANNTVIPARPDVPCWLMIHPAKDNTPSRRVLVRNNIAAQIIVQGETLTVDHNIAEQKISIENDGQLAGDGWYDRREEHHRPLDLPLLCWFRSRSWTLRSSPRRAESGRTRRRGGRRTKT